MFCYRYIYHAPGLKTIPSPVFHVELPRLKLLDLENNLISKITSTALSVKAEELLLNYNVIEEVEDMAFNGSQVAKLDLSETSITHLPTRGLQELEVLRLQDTDTLKVFPSIYNFEYIREAWLTYPYHCCAFHFPAKHDPAEYIRHQELVEKRCYEMTTESTPHDGFHRHVRRFVNVGNVNSTGWGGLGVVHASVPLSSLEADGTFHQTGLTLLTKVHHALCGNLSKNYHDVACHPAPDAFNPCEDLMGNWALRVAVWLVAIAALVGNLAVLLVLLSSRFRMTVPKFLMCNLAMADFCMGIYLLLIACMDARSIGAYFNHAIDWQIVFASELSIFTLTVITSERWYTITYAIHLNKRLKLSTAGKIMAIGWVYAIAMAALPLVGVSGYSTTSICLPMENKDPGDLAYLVTLLSFNGLDFWVICACYGRMYCSIRGGQDAVAALARSDMTVAKRMALLVFTDFACWAPIAFFGLTALAGYPLIDVPHTKILLVFFYPLNSCANPYLYALLTQQYRRDFFILLSRYGLCSQRAARGCDGGACIGRGAGIPESGCGGPGHRGSLLTTVTSVDSPNTRPGSLTAVPESIARHSTIELVPIGDGEGNHEQGNGIPKGTSFL
ncbi:Follicle-stimulating hormone receptor [Blattella germanica]|nr:Follicle-stimulating hormone receptor [Blattella germanica]